MFLSMSVLNSLKKQDCLLIILLFIKMIRRHKVKIFKLIVICTILDIEQIECK